MSHSLQPHGLLDTRLLCPSVYPRICSYSCPLIQWRLLTISSSVAPFSFCLHPFPTSVSFPVSLFFASGGQSIGASALALIFPMNFHGWFPLGLTGLILRVHWISRRSNYLLWYFQWNIYKSCKKENAKLTSFNSQLKAQFENWRTGFSVLWFTDI